MVHERVRYVKHIEAGKVKNYRILLEVNNINGLD